mgnify:CR=1 FL=1
MSRTESDIDDVEENPTWTENTNGSLQQIVFSSQTQDMFSESFIGSLKSSNSWNSDSQISNYLVTQLQASNNASKSDFNTLKSSATHSKTQYSFHSMTPRNDDNSNYELDVLNSPMTISHPLTELSQTNEDISSSRRKFELSMENSGTPASLKSQSVDSLDTDVKPKEFRHSTPGMSYISQTQLKGASEITNRITQFSQQKSKSILQSITQSDTSSKNFSQTHELPKFYDESQHSLSSVSKRELGNTIQESRVSSFSISLSMNPNSVRNGGNNSEFDTHLSRKSMDISQDQNSFVLNQINISNNLNNNSSHYKNTEAESQHLINNTFILKGIISSIKRNSAASESISLMSLRGSYQLAPQSANRQNSLESPKNYCITQFTEHHSSEKPPRRSGFPSEKVNTEKEENSVKTSFLILSNSLW